jgi:hypothetical protein
MMKIIHGISKLVGGQMPVIIYNVYSTNPCFPIVPPDPEAIPAGDQEKKKRNTPTMHLKMSPSAALLTLGSQLGEPDP